MKLLLSTILSISFTFAWSTQLQAQDNEASWEQAIDHTAKSILAIRVDGTRNFDTQGSSSTQATGFVIDAELGIVLTNRHVVQPGPVIARGAFLNREEVTLIPIYRDPVHDFGFFKYDPNTLTHNTPIALPLKPEQVQLGREIRVIGNDGGEQLSILTGTISRLDRSAPAYGQGKYNDFNTFYIQAASSTSGGSSGAPVIDIDGNVIALNAGANAKTASSFFLPLNRAVRAYELIRQGKPVPRGTLQANFRQQPYDELKRLGLSKRSEQVVRLQKPEAIGLLTLTSTVPNGPADTHLNPGDILLKINEQWVRDFITLESILDDSVDKKITVTVERAGEPLDIQLTVQDMNEVTPAEYISIGGAILHNLSYQQARNFYTPVAGIYVAKAGYMFGNDGISRGNVITEIAGQAVNYLSDAEPILKALANGERFSVRFFALNNPRQALHQVVTMDRRWFPAESCHRDDAQGLWPCNTWAAAPEAAPIPPSSTRFIHSADPIVERIAPSLLVVDFDMPYPVEGVNHAHYVGSGLIVDAKRGWVLVDRNTVPSMLGDVYLTFAESLEVPGKVEFIHPFHNFAIVSYDPRLIGDTAVRSAEFSKQTMQIGDEVWLIGAKNNHRLTSHKTTVADMDSLLLPLPRIPSFREANIEVISLTSSINTVGGVLTDKEGKITALWTSFQYQKGKSLAQMHVGIPSELIQEMLDNLNGKTDAEFRHIGAELQPISLAQARKRGLPDEWANKIEHHNPQRRSVLYTARLVAGTPASSQLHEGDIILAINDQTVNQFREVEQAVQTVSVNLTILRHRQIQNIELATEALTGKGLTRVINWAGAVLHKPHRAIAEQRGFAPQGLYVSWTWPGSPAAHYGFARTLRLIALDDFSITDIDSLLAALRETAGQKSVRLKVLNLMGKTHLITLKPDEHYWPTEELIKTTMGWQRLPFSQPPI